MTPAARQPMATLCTTEWPFPILSPQGVRLCRMERMLRTGAAVPRRRLSPDASLAAFKRDLSTLRLDLGATIVYDSLEHGYRLLNRAEWRGLLPLVARELGTQIGGAA